ncbi:MAG: RdgB/HAM1 family non-canonical purine NTP pyrophosphatase [Anaerolineaceae bacterium]|jgi:XTP/dITP diphosphohydrolase|nr:RdgB/HAM1 family non-canonical purine NTP pyrophosphatase [Anaerolineaceae bacterium]
MFTLLIATGNPGKMIELQGLLKDLPVKLVTPAEVGLSDFDVVEDGHTYAENAAKKALAYCRASGLSVLADDSGLEVDALHGAPGLHSARYAPRPGATDADRRALMLKNLRGLPQPWTARFRCTVAVATPEGSLDLTEGICEGEIAPEERGTDGFGYDPIFFVPELGLTMAEMSRQQKNTLSHRARAVNAAIPVLKKLL